MYQVIHGLTADMNDIIKQEIIRIMRSKLDHETPEVHSKNLSQYKKGVTHESMKPGDADKGRRPKEESNTGGMSD